MCFFLKPFISNKISTIKKLKLLEDTINKQAERIKTLEVLNINLQNENIGKIEKSKVQELKVSNNNKDKLIISLQNQIAELKLKLYRKNK